ncbi:hypothetical protein [Gelidibacter pelagius]|uniref:GLPGLI family protein n=1 Tax=Gelidibacter pelagius TaxID=2819985 RepID=A0ABS3SWW4_9FLAO|nr:hypothetical protein [Gelidibacter pelagius]MBO3100228.1 hypothetical protein [Gelidibacter pelagius]
MKRKFFILIILLIVSIQVKGQYNYNVIPTMDYFRIVEMTEKDLTIILSELDIEGSPYLEENFTNGTIYTTSKQKIIDIPVRYNIYSDNLEFKTPEAKILAISNPETLELIDFGKYKMEYISYVNKKQIKSSFFKIVEEGNATLYAKPEVFFQEEVKGDGIRPSRSAKFIPKSDLYYISIDNKPAVKIESKKDLINVLSDQQKEILLFLKENKVKNITKDDQLQRIVKYYNSL